MDVFSFDSRKLVDAYEAVGGEVVELVAETPVARLDDKIMGSWTFRVLIGHIMRSYSGVVGYLDQGTELDPHMFGPSSYYLAAFESGVSSAKVDGRAFAEAEKLHEGFASDCRSAYDHAVTKLANAALDAPVKTPFGIMQLEHYLPSRIVELVVHGEDLKAALGSDRSLDPTAVEVATLVCAALANKHGYGIELLLASTGRSQIADNFNVLDLR